MTNKPISKQIDIHERIYKFVCRVLKLLASLPKNSINQTIIDQCSRSVTSVGANDQEADACESKKDFIAKYTIAKKELKETNYWLRLITNINPNFKNRMKELQQKGKELLLIISSIVRKTKTRK